MNKTLLSIVLLIILTGVSLQSSGNASVSAPAIEWQKEYGNIDTQSVSNLIQTSDGGYAFIDKGWGYQFTFVPSTFYKVDSSGNMQWNLTIHSLNALTLIQTNDRGYEISGYWYTSVTPYKETPTLVKMDFQGNIQWVANYSSVPDLGVASTSIQTSDGGYAYLQFGSTPLEIYGGINVSSGSIVKTDSNNNTQWVKNLTYTSVDGTFPLVLSSLIETSDGALAGLGVGLYFIENPRRGKIYLVRTEAFLPLPLQTPLPTPISTPSSAVTPTPLPSPYEIPIIGVAFIVIVFGAGLGLLIYLIRRK